MLGIGSHCNQLNSYSNYGRIVVNELINKYDYIIDCEQLRLFCQSIVVCDYTKIRRANLEVCRRNISIPNSFTPKFVIIVTGNIASGKSTIVHGLIEYFNLENIPLLSNDLIRSLLFDDTTDYTIKQNQAKEYIDKEIQRISDEGTSFIWETMLTSSKKMDTINSLKTKGYKIITFYVETLCVDINIDRAIGRSKEGGHFLGAEFIIDRQDKTVSYIASLSRITDVMVIIDNTERPIITSRSVL